MFYEVRQTAEFAEWLDGLTNVQAQKAIARRIVRVSAGLIGDSKSVGHGISELRVDTGPGYRVYYTIRQRVVVILLHGGTKGTQARDIAKARELLAALE